MTAYGSVLELIGNTPLVDISQLSPNPDVRILIKLEGQNPGGSVKDRIALSMIEQAEKDGLLKPGQTLIEPSSGNTGIGMALVCRLKGYHLKVVLATNVSIERRQLLEVWGAEIIESPGSEGSNGAVRRAQALADDHPECAFLYQYANPANPKAHYEGTGPEIWRDCPEVTHFVAGLGTSGTLLGVGRFLKEQNPAVKVLAIEPDRRVRSSTDCETSTTVTSRPFSPRTTERPCWTASGSFDLESRSSGLAVSPRWVSSPGSPRVRPSLEPPRRRPGSMREPSWWWPPTADGSTCPPRRGPETSMTSRSGRRPSPTSKLRPPLSLRPPPPPRLTAGPTLVQCSTVPQNRPRPPQGRAEWREEPPELALRVLGCDGSWTGPGGAGSGYLVSLGGTHVVLDLGPGTFANLQLHLDPALVAAVVITHRHPEPLDRPVFVGQPCPLRPRSGVAAGVRPLRSRSPDGSERFSHPRLASGVRWGIRPMSAP